MQAKYGDDVQFFMVYTREAHAIDSNSPARKNVEQPVSTEERREVALAFLKEMEYDLPALLDNIDDNASKDYASLPDRLFLIGKDGKIAYGSQRGPRGFKPDELEQAIQEELGKKGGSSVSRSQPSNPQNERRTRMLQLLPAFSAINKDGDDQLSKNEIESATESLLTLDKNGDGELTQDELRPSRRRR